MSSAVAGHRCARQPGCHTIRQRALRTIVISTFGATRGFMRRSHRFGIVVGAERPWARWEFLHICLRFARLFVSERFLIKKTDLLNCATLIRFNCALIEKNYGPVPNCKDGRLQIQFRGLSVGKSTGCWNQRAKKMIRDWVRDSGTKKHTVLHSQPVLLILNDSVYDSTTSAWLRAYMHGSHLSTEREGKTTKGYISKKGLAACTLVM